MEKSIMNMGLTPRQIQKVEVLLGSNLIHQIAPNVYETESIAGWTKLGHIVTVGRKSRWYWPFKDELLYSCTCQWARSGNMCSHVAAVMAL